MDRQLLVKRFIFGMAVGIFLAMVAWSYSAYFYASIRLDRGIIGSLLLAILGGAIATIGDLGKAIDNINLPFL